MTPRNQAQQRASLARRYTTSLVIRRGTTTLTAQLVAVATLGRASRERQTAGSLATQADVEVWGPPSLDIARGDRFTWDGLAHEVTLVRGGRTVATVAEAVQVQ